MKIQPISTTNYAAKTNLKKCSNNVKHPESKAGISFKGYESLLKNIIMEDIPNSIYAESYFFNLYKALKQDPAAIKTPYLSILERYEEFSTDIWKFLNIICRPIADVPSDLRDIVFEAEKREIPLIEKGYDNPTFLLMHEGKHGIISNFFNSQNARNNIKFVFQSGTNNYEVGLTKDKWFWTRQSDLAGWKEGVYGLTSRRSQKSEVYIDFTGFPPV